MAERWGGHVGAGDWPAKSDLPEQVFQDAFRALDARDKRKLKKSGSVMSDKQMARAAVEGRRLIFRTVAFTPLDGYVVGMDDFHWLIASPGELEHEPVFTTLVHKTCPLISFTDTFLVDEPEPDRKRIQQIGRAFWEFCAISGLTRPTNHQESQS